MTAFLSYGQQNVGIGTDNPNLNALLELASDDKGFLMPRLNTNAKNTLGVLCGLNEEGLVVYDTEEDLFFYWDGSQWIPYPSSGSGDQWGGLPNHEVSWTIYAERNDIYMQSHPELRNPEVAKKPFNIGKYFHPQNYNLGEEYRIYPRNDRDLRRE